MCGVLCEQGSSGERSGTHGLASLILTAHSNFLPGSWGLGLWDSQAVKDTELPWREVSVSPRDDPRTCMFPSASPAGTGTSVRSPVLDHWATRPRVPSHSVLWKVALVITLSQWSLCKAPSLAAPQGLLQGLAAPACVWASPCALGAHLGAGVYSVGPKG